MFDKYKLWSYLQLPKDTPYLALSGKPWGVCCEHSGENWHYNRTYKKCFGYAFGKYHHYMGIEGGEGDRGWGREREKEEFRVP